MAYVHDQGIIHRDLNPTNIILRENDGAMCPTDFGVAKLKYFGGKTTTKVVGTFPYMAVEQYQLEAYQATDVHAIGAILIEMLTGKTLDKFVERNHSIETKKVVLPDTLDIGLKMVLEKSVETYASRRYQDCKQFSRALQSLLGNGATDVVIGSAVPKVIGDVSLDEILNVYDKRSDDGKLVFPERFQKMLSVLLDNLGYTTEKGFRILEHGQGVKVFKPTSPYTFVELKNLESLQNFLGSWKFHIEGMMAFKYATSRLTLENGAREWFEDERLTQLWFDSPYLHEVVETIMDLKKDLFKLESKKARFGALKWVPFYRKSSIKKIVEVDKKIENLLDLQIPPEQIEEWKPYHGEIRTGRDAIMALVE